ncbi:MAG: hypothetical protein ABI782_11590 [Anaerolineaceae bacterium]
MAGEQAEKLTSSKSIGNAFQNIARAREKFAQLRVDPFDGLNGDDYEYLRLNIEKRHVLGHNLGLADERYAEVATGAQPGRTIVLLADEVLRFTQLAGGIVRSLEEQAFPGPAEA